MSVKWICRGVLRNVITQRGRLSAVATQVMNYRKTQELVQVSNKSEKINKTNTCAYVGNSFLFKIKM